MLVGIVSGSGYRRKTIDDEAGCRAKGTTVMIMRWTEAIRYR